MSFSIEPLLYLVIVNWNRCRDTIECLESWERQTYSNFCIIVVDNGSSDGSVEEISKRFPRFEIITLPANLGFGAGFNRGIKQAMEKGADFIGIINNDTVADPFFLEELIKEAKPGVGVLAPKIYFYHDPDRIWSVGGLIHPLTLEMTAKGTGQKDRGQWGEVKERDYFTGCALLVPREIFERVGFFDERFFAYYEDMDFCLRIHRAGYRLVLVPNAKLWHKVATTSGGSDSPSERYFMAKGSVLFFRKHIQGWRWVIVAPYRLGSAIKTTFRLVMQRKWPSAKAYWRGLIEGLNRETF